MTCSSEHGMNLDIAALRYRVASLVVLADRMSAADLRELIGLEPDRSWDQGDSVGRTGRGRRHSTGWSIDAAGMGLRPESAIGDILDRVATVADRIRAAAADPRVRSVALWVWPEDPEHGVDLSPARVMEISRLGAALRIDLHTLDIDLDEREDHDG